MKATPFATHLHGTNELCSAFESLFITALQEWEQDIAAGRIDEGKIKNWGRLMASRVDAEKKALPRGLSANEKLKRLAKSEADAYFNGLCPEGLRHAWSASAATPQRGQTNRHDGGRDPAHGHDHSHACQH